jgi:hypothetical protein
MAMGPVFECPYEIANSFEAAFAAQHIRVEGLNTSTTSANRMKAFRFRGRLGSITGNQLNCEHHVLLWLTFPKYRGLNPLAWPFDHSLLNRIERVLVNRGAIRRNWEVFGEVLEKHE